MRNLKRAYCTQNNMSSGFHLWRCYASYIAFLSIDVNKSHIGPLKQAFLVEATQHMLIYNPNGWVHPFLAQRWVENNSAFLQHIIYSSFDF